MGMEADAALCGAAGVVVPDPVGLKDLCGSVVHLDRNGKVDFLHRAAQKLPGAAVKLQNFGDSVKLCLRIFKGVVCCRHDKPPHL